MQVKLNLAVVLWLIETKDHLLPEVNRFTSRLRFIHFILTQLNFDGTALVDDLVHWEKLMLILEYDEDCVIHELLSYPDHFSSVCLHIIES